MWYVWFTSGFFAGFIIRNFIDFFYSNEVNFGNLKRFISRFRVFGWFQTSISTFSHESVSSTRNDLDQSQQRRQRVTSYSWIDASSEGSGQTPIKYRSTSHFSGEIPISNGPVQNNIRPGNTSPFSNGNPTPRGPAQTRLKNTSHFFEGIPNPGDPGRTRPILRNTSYSAEENTSPQAKFPYPNIAFYQNKIPAKPNHECIEEILTKWSGNYKILQENSCYIQWLFPNKTPGSNKEAHVLTDYEAEIIQQTPELKNRVKSAFIMMLDFYGMKLTKYDQIELSEKPNARLKQLNQNGNHHFLYITRILMALKELGLNNLVLPWMVCLGDLIYRENKLKQAKSSFENYWLKTLYAEEEGELLGRYPL